MQEDDIPTTASNNGAENEADDELAIPVINSPIISYEPPKSYELRKHVGAIHTHSRLTVVQKQAADFLLLNAFDNLLTQEQHRVPVSELCNHLNFNSKNTNFLKETLRALRSYPIEWNQLDKDGNEDWTTSSIVAEANIKNGIITYSYGPALRQKLASPEVYALLDVRIQVRFKSVHALNLWQNCYRFAKVGSTGFISIDQWKLLLLGSDPATTYKEFKDFKRYVLDPSIETVNTVSNIRVTPEYKKQGRKVVAIKFLIEPAVQQPLSLAEKFEIDQEALKTLIEEFGIEQSKATEVCSGYPKDYIMEKIVYARSQKTNRRMRNIGGWLIRALEMDFKFTPPKSSTRPTPTPKPTDAEVDVASKFNKFQVKFVEKYLTDKNEGELQEIETKFADQLDMQTKKTYKSKGMDSKLISSMFNAYVANEVIGKETLLLEFAKEMGF